ncbi:hypothetical protein N9Q84_03690 [Flavobacteriaceae bacterium]|jgi:hypothetical protein|nr:hypothetical protein [Flavobacteriaceae bacterium]MDB4127192.1 hypothetical protein [Flavobacteriaceae bacterium]|tara:strand:+ start:375 stop:539 length:165 start_codon:yes stop_codon:yes gene_type:complete
MSAYINHNKKLYGTGEINTKEILRRKKVYIDAPQQVKDQMDADNRWLAYQIPVS